MALQGSGGLQKDFAVDFGLAHRLAVGLGVFDLLLERN
jgi:hypothetical protein